MEDFDIAPSKIGESAQRVVDRAIEESRRRDHAQVTNEHVFLAFAQVEWDTFSQVMTELDLQAMANHAGEVISEQVLTPSDAYQHLIHGRTEEVRIRDLPGRVAALMIVPYPPGIPVLMPGERVDPAGGTIVNFLEAVEAFGGKVAMTSPDHPTGTDRIAEAIDQRDRLLVRRYIERDDQSVARCNGFVRKRHAAPFGVRAHGMLSA